MLQRLGSGTASRRTGSRHFAMHGLASCPYSADRIRLCRGLEHHEAEGSMTNLTTLKTSFMGDVYAVPASWDTAMVSTLQPFGFARAARHKHRPEGARSPRQDSLVGHALIRAQRRFRREQIRCDIRVFVG
jgi:hypothetical protein